MYFFLIWHHFLISKTSNWNYFFSRNRQQQQQKNSYKKINLIFCHMFSPSIIKFVIYIHTRTQRKNLQMKKGIKFRLKHQKNLCKRRRRKKIFTHFFPNSLIHDIYRLKFFFSFIILTIIFCIIIIIILSSFFFHLHKNLVFVYVSKILEKKWKIKNSSIIPTHTLNRF